MTATVLPRHGDPVEDVKKAEADDLKCWSVTTLIGALAKDALVYWSAEQTAKCAVEQYKAWVAIAKDAGPDEAVKWLTGARFRTPAGERTAADLGTAVHAAIETYTLNGVRPEVDDEVAPFLEQFDRWAQVWQPEYLASEVTVFNASAGYAGTCDAFAVVDGERVIVDYKSSRKSFDKRGKETAPFPEVAVQLAAYRFAELAAAWRPRRFEQFKRRYYLLSEVEREAALPVPEVDFGLAVHITPEHCTAYPVRCDDEVFERFLFIVEAARWQFDMSKHVIGPPLVKAEG